MFKKKLNGDSNKYFPFEAFLRSLIHADSYVVIYVVTFSVKQFCTFLQCEGLKTGVSTRRALMKFLYL